MSAVTYERVKVYRQGKPTYLRTVTVAGTKIILQGSLLRIARAHDEWFTEVKAAENIVEFLRAKRIADIFTFWQTLPHTSPEFAFPMESAAISALPITSYEHWASTQVRKEVRKNIKKASRRGVDIRRVSFDDVLVSGMTEIFNESPVRQGKRFWHYGKGVDEVRVEMGQDLERSQFIGAYFEDRLIGFYKLIPGDCFAQPVMSISMIKHRDKYADTALIAEAVRFCAEQGLRYLTYGDWRRDSHRDFLESHGFQKLALPRYYVPLTRLGSVTLKLGMHKGLRESVKSAVPESLLAAALSMRARFHRWRYAPEVDSAAISNDC